jgi:hypothetical protein
MPNIQRDSRTLTSLPEILSYFSVFQAEEAERYHLFFAMLAISSSSR